MIITRLSGGLGNQMFQYAAGYALAKFLGAELLFDTEWFSMQRRGDVTERSLDISHFDVFIPIASKEQIQLARYPRGLFSHIREIYVKKIRREYEVDWTPGFFNSKRGNVYLNGYYQSENFFRHVRSEIRNSFKLRPQLDEEFANASSLLDSIKEPISVHVRRGDYINNKKTSKLHNICDANYFHKALRIMEDKVGVRQLVLFSDDSEWVKNHLSLPKSTIYISDQNFNFRDEHRSNLELMLMSKCSHHIISNSTFSWWGAYLNNSVKKCVIAPSLWNLGASIKHDTILPPGWLKVSSPH